MRVRIIKVPGIYGETYCVQRRGFLFWRDLAEYFMLEHAEHYAERYRKFIIGSAEVVKEYEV